MQLLVRVCPQEIANETSIRHVSRPHQMHIVSIWWQVGYALSLVCPHLTNLLIWSQVVISGDNPPESLSVHGPFAFGRLRRTKNNSSKKPCMQMIFSSMIAHTGMQLKTSQNCFHSLGRRTQGSAWSIKYQAAAKWPESSGKSKHSDAYSKQMFSNYASMQSLHR